VKRPGRAGNHSYAAVTEVKNEGSYTFASPAFLHGVDGENFNFYYYPSLNKITQIHWLSLYCNFIEHNRVKLLLRLIATP